MQVTSDIVGIRLKEYRTRVTWRQTTNFAASVSDMNHRYFDDRRPEGLAAPPAYAFAVSWPVLSNLPAYMDLPYPPEVVATMVHYLEHVDFHRLIRPGDELVVRGEAVAVLPHRAGTHVVFRFDVADAHGEPVHTEYIGGMLRGVTCLDGGRGAERLPPVVETPRAGAPDQPLWDAPIPIGPEAPYIYDGCTDLSFAIHTSPAFAEAVGLPGIILQGTATMALAARELIDREAGGDPFRVTSLAGRFRSVVRPGGSIQVELMARATEPEGTGLSYRVLNDEGREAISHGYLRLRS